MSSFGDSDSSSSSSSSSSSMIRAPVTWDRVSIIGKGSYGIVYKVTYNSLFGPLERFAVKTSHLHDSSLLAKEYRILQALGGCPEIIHCFSYQETLEYGLDLYNLFLEYTPLGTLQYLIEKSGGPGLQERDVRFYTRTILEGLRFMHDRGYVHCNLKPDNILLFPDPHDGAETVLPYRLKIANLGLAVEPGVEIPLESWKFRFRGTASFMSPESVLLGQIGPALDIWSLGCIVLVMLTRKNMWHESSDRLSVEDFMLKTWVIEPTILKHVSEDGKEFLRKCFEKDPKKRWSAHMLLGDPYLSS